MVVAASKGSLGPRAGKSDRSPGDVRCWAISVCVPLSRQSAVHANVCHMERRVPERGGGSSTTIDCIGLGLAARADSLIMN